MFDMSFLNNNQLFATNWGKGALLVLAGPGSGKTLVLTMRVARLIQNEPEARFKVLGLTFTTKAADEMKERVENLLGPYAQRARLTTFHSFCAEVLRQHGSHINLKPDFKIITQDADRLKALNQSSQELDEFNTSNFDSRVAIKMIDHLLREGHDGSLEMPLPFVGSGKDWILPIYNSYINILIRNNHLDFGTLLICTLRLFREQPKIADHYKIVYPYVCIDEYQDSNKAQDSLLRALCPKMNANLFVVADDDQIIYQWNGASPERLKRLQYDYKMQTIQLPESYRCPHDVIKLANNLIQFNQERSPGKKNLTSATTSTDSDSIRVRQFKDHNEEMKWVAQDIADRSLQPAQCAILARTTKLLDLVVDALKINGLSPHQVKRKNEFESPLLRFVHSALRLANAPQNYDQLLMLCNSYFDLMEVRIQSEEVEAESAIHSGALLRGFLDVARHNLPTSIDVTPLLDSLHNHLVERLMYQEFTNNAFEWGTTQLKFQNNPEILHDNVKDEIQVWKNLKRQVRQHSYDEPSLNQFLQELDLRQKSTPPKQTDIQCLTIHLAKGKEFQNVYLIGLAEDELPSFHAIQKGNDSREIEEERRNCFVAITRVQSNLTLTFSKSYYGWPKQPSRFLIEMGINTQVL